MTEHLPQVIHTYQSHILDSTFSQQYQPRADDLFIGVDNISNVTTH